jgi:hypothetical protein
MAVGHFDCVTEANARNPDHSLKGKFSMTLDYDTTTLLVSQVRFTNSTGSARTVVIGGQTIVVPSPFTGGPVDLSSFALLMLNTLGIRSPGFSA